MYCRVNVNVFPDPAEAFCIWSTEIVVCWMPGPDDPNTKLRKNPRILKSCQGKHEEAAPVDSGTASQMIYELVSL